MTQRICKPIPFYDSIKLESAERLYNAKYIGPWSIKDKNGNWSLHPVEVFYQPELKDPSHSHYFGLYMGPEGHVYICNAESAFSENITGVIADDGEIIVSGYRHDYRTSKDGTAFIDGGRDYIRTNPNRNVVSLKMINGELVVS